MRPYKGPQDKVVFVNLIKPTWVASVRLMKGQWKHHFKNTFKRPSKCLWRAFSKVPLQCLWKTLEVPLKGLDARWSWWSWEGIPAHLSVFLKCPQVPVNSLSRPLQHMLIGLSYALISGLNRLIRTTLFRGLLRSFVVPFQGEETTLQGFIKYPLKLLCMEYPL